MAVTGPIPIPQTGMDALLSSAGSTQNILSNMMANRRANQTQPSLMQQYNDIHQQHVLANQAAQQKQSLMQQYLAQLGLSGQMPGNQTNVAAIDNGFPSSTNANIQQPSNVSPQTAPLVAQDTGKMTLAPSNLNQVMTSGNATMTPKSNLNDLMHPSSSQAPPSITPQEAQSHGINVPQGYKGELTYAFTPKDNLGMALQALNKGTPPIPTYKMDAQGNTQVMIPGKGIYTIRRDPNVVAQEQGDIAASKEAGKDRSKRMSAIRQELTEGAGMGDTLNEYDHVFGNEGYQKVAQQPFFRGQTLDWIKNHPSPGQEDIVKAATDLESLGNTLTSDKAKLFKGPFRKFEYDLVSSLIPTKNDSLSSALEKYRLLKTFYEMGKQRRVRMLQLMQNKVPENEAYDQADKEVKGSGLREDVNNKIVKIERRAGADKFVRSNPWPAGATKLAYNNKTKKYEYLYK